MALKVGELYALLKLDSAGFSSGLKTARADMQGIGQGMMTLGAGMTAAITAPLVGIGIAAVKAAANMEQTKIALTTMLGSADKADEFIQKLTAFSEATPFQKTDLLTASKQLIAFGYNAEEIIPMMTSLGNAISSVGGSSETINRVIMQLGQMKAIGRVSMEDLRPMAEAGIKVFDYLATGLGKTKAQIMSLMSAGQLTAETAIPAMIKAMGEDPKLKGMMDRQSKGILGMFSNLVDAINNTLVPLGQPLAEIGKNVLDALKPVMANVRQAAEWFAKLPKPIQVAGVALALLAAAAGPLLLLLGSAISSLVTILPALPAIGSALAAIGAAATGPIGWIVAAVVALGVALAAAWKHSKKFRDTVLEAWSSIKAAFAGLWDSIKKLGVALAPFIDALKMVGGGIIKAGLAGLAFLLKVIVFAVTEVVEAITFLTEQFIKLFTWLFKKPPMTLIELLTRVAIVGVRQAIKYGEAIKEQKRIVQEAAEAEAKAVLDVLEQRRKAADEERKRRMDAIGWGSVEEVWKSAMVTGQKAGFARTAQPAQMSVGDLPSTKELQEIRKQLKATQKTQDQLLKTVQERLGVYAV
jgi:tape measure domain-containing protein